MSATDDQEPVARRVWQQAARVLVARAQRRLEQPGADLDVDGDDMEADWDENSTGWLEAKRTAVRAVMAATSSLDMVVAVRGAELLGAVDVNRRGASDVRFWGVKVGTPFDLYRLRDVPLRDAMPLNDFGARTTRLRDARQGWALARKYAERHPFKRIR